MMPITLYFLPRSAPARAALITCRALGLDVEVKTLNLFQKEHLTPEFLKINPQHTVPVLDDNGFIVFDSHVIASYLASKYGKDDSLYPKDLSKRALVDQRLYLDATILFPRLRNISYPTIYLGKTTVDEEAKKSLFEALSFVESFLEPTGWLAGPNYTIADFTCVATVTSIEAIGVNMSKYPRIQSWIKRCKDSIPNFEEANEEGLKEFREQTRSKIQPGQLD